MTQMVLVFPGPRPFAWPPALATNLCLPALAPNLYLPTPGPQFVFTAPWPSFCIYRPWPIICIYRPWLPICIYRPWPTILLPVRGLSWHIPTLSPWFVFVFTVLAYDLYYRSVAWICIYLIIGSSSSGSSNSNSSSNFFAINNTNICMPILVN